MVKIHRQTSEVWNRIAKADEPQLVRFVYLTVAFSMLKNLQSPQLQMDTTATFVSAPFRVKVTVTSYVEILL